MESKSDTVKTPSGRLSERKPEDSNFKWEDRLNVLVAALIHATRCNRLLWRSDREGNGPSYEFNSSPSFSCFRNGITIHTCDSLLIIRNEAGQEIVNDYHGSFRELYVEARRMAMQADEIVDALLKELKKL